MISILSVFLRGKCVEVGLIGKGGFVGLPLVAGFRTASTRAVAQIDATAFRIDSAVFIAQLSRCPTLARHLHRYSRFRRCRLRRLPPATGSMKSMGACQQEKLEAMACECYGIMQQQTRQWEIESE